MSQGNFCNCLKQTKISFKKKENKKAGQALSWELVPVGAGKMWGKGVGG
jgi:hypothetical protein